MGYPHGVHRRRGELPASAWLLYIANLLWTVGYDTYYAMVDRDDDLKIGVKSTAILFGEADRTIILTLQMLSLGCLLLAGNRFDMGMVPLGPACGSWVLCLGILVNAQAGPGIVLQGLPAQSLGRDADLHRCGGGLRIALSPAPSLWNGFSRESMMIAPSHSRVNPLCKVQGLAICQTSFTPSPVLSPAFLSLMKVYSGLPS